MRQKGERPQKHLKFGTSAFLPALADPYNWIYQKKMLDKECRPQAKFQTRFHRVRQSNEGEASCR